MKTHVDQDDVRRNKDDTCFYCGQPVGSEHTWECVIPTVKRSVTLTVTYKRSFPRSWDDDACRFKMHGSSWCRGNALEEIGEFVGDGCICDIAEMEIVEEAATPPDDQ